MAGKKKILVVDDEELIRECVKAQLEKEGYSVEMAADAEEAMATISRQIPDLMLLDIKMPGPDGLQFCRLLKDDEKTKRVPILMFTVMDDKRAKFKSETSGADGYILKTKDFTGLSKEIEKYLS